MIKPHQFKRPMRSVATITSRQAAMLQGRTYYFTGKPCKRGNVAYRNVISRECQCKDCQAYRNVARKSYPSYSAKREAEASPVSQVQP